MSKTIIGAIAAVIILAGLGGVLVMNNKDKNPSVSTPTAEHSDHAGNHEEAVTNTVQTNQVQIKDYAFTPTKITVKKGTKVTWTNQDDVKHDITPDSESPDFTASELFGKGESYSTTFNKAGTYAYHCSPHPYMKATVEVTE